MIRSRLQERDGGTTMKALVFVAFVVIVLATIFYLTSGSPTGPDSSARPQSIGRPVTLVFARGKDSIKLDPADIDDGESVKVTVNVFDGLLRYKAGSTEVEPALAKSWRISADGRTYTFQLRQGVTFHDGTPFDAAAVLYTFRRQMDQDHPAHFGDFGYWGSMYHMVKAIEATGQHEVVIRLTASHAPFLTNLAMFPVSIVSPTAMDRLGKTFREHPVGTGAFRFVEWRKGERIVLEANDEYWDGRPKIDRLIFIPVESNSNRLNVLKTGQADGMDGVSPADLNLIRADPALVVHEAAGMNVGYLALNNEKPPFTDARVRRAVALAIDREALVRGLYQGAAVVAVHPLPPTIWAYPPDARPPAVDIAAARALLQQAGWYDGEPPPIALHTMTNPRPYMPQPSKVAQVIKAQLARIGMTVRIVEHTWSEHLELTRKGAHQMALLGWTGDNGDPDNFLYVLLGSANTKPGTASNISFYRSAEVDALLREAQRVAGQAKRTALYRQALERIARDVPLVPLVHARQVVVFRRGVEGFRLHPTGIFLFHGVRVRE